MRPQLSEDTLGEVQDRIRHKTRIPPDRLTVEEQLEILLDVYDEQERKLELDPDRQRL